MTHNERQLVIGYGLVALALTVAMIGGCTDTERAHWNALGDPAHVVCYSGGKLVADDYSTGKVQNPEGSDGYEFKSVMTGKLRQVSGDCQIDYGVTPAAGWKGL